MPTLAETNKNPLNLRPLPGGEKWQGQVGTSTNSVSGTFCVFDSNVMGVRAAVINMRSYVKVGDRTLRDVIHRWAPPNENDPGNYLRIVCSEAAVPENFDMTPLVMSNPTQAWMGRLIGIVRAMNRVEAGSSTITVEETREGIERALGVPKGYVRQDDGNVVREDMKQSETLKLTNQGQLANVAATSATAVTAISSIPDWRVALIVAGMVVLSGIGVGFYLWSLRRERQKMSAEGIA